MAQAYTATDSDFQSLTLVGVALECAVKVNIAEAAYNANNPSRIKNQVSVSMSGDEKVAQVNATLPITQVIGTDGAPSFAATDYLGSTYTTFDPGSGTGALKSHSIIAALLEIAHRVQAAELAFPENDRPNNVQIEYSSDAQQVTVTMNLPISEAIVAGTGAVAYTAVDYL